MLLDYLKLLTHTIGLKLLLKFISLHLKMRNETFSEIQSTSILIIVSKKVMLQVVNQNILNVVTMRNKW